MERVKVLVTGASGFVAKHCIAEALKHGYGVRATLRSRDRADAVRTAIARAGIDATGVEFVLADLGQDAGWDAAADGCRFVMHVASPFPLEQPSDREEVIAPARDGSLRVLAAAMRAGVRRVVLTSSTVAVTLPRNDTPGRTYTEADWTDAERTSLTPYMQSKTLAERAAWDFVARKPAAPELVVVNPSFIQGPALDGDLSTSLEVLRLMARGSYPAAPRLGFPVTDVRDVAKLHVAALTAERAAGERFICSNGHLRLVELGQILGRTLPDLKSKVPRFELPDLAVRLLSNFDKRLKSVLPELGHPRYVSNEKARRTFGIEFHDAEDAVRAAALSLRELGVI